ncbi:methylmalonic aciduria type A homolog, mitochondrial isoform X1 [Penaeus vannamei]|uniref:methylmalonic aciduria type A homolog, mitochondrial isoform X1 n=1 Tax=Penaeus vannamei TaxID=6689 RepID=UPI000F68EC91|nr:methylmalonic aciduria type A homolog, mitochondrial-like isoform X1 [Penaeus vannamei]
MSFSLLSRHLHRSVSQCWQRVPAAAGTLDPLVARLLKGLHAGQRASLAESITLVETSHPKKKLQARQLLSAVLQEATETQYRKGTKALSFRLGLSGPPGAGKSTFIETLGKFLTARGHKVAVLAVDPSSVTTGGSLLGDKTRMHELSRDMNAYIRPSPSRGHLGGVTRSTNEAIVLCEAAGFDIVIVETIGVGQSEFSVVDMVDLFTLLIPPGGGDELQGLKRGIMEMSDLIVVNKSDGDLVPAARRMQYEYISALKFIRPKNIYWKTPVKRISSQTGEGVPELWDLMQKYRITMEESGEYLRRRQDQRRAWLWTHLKDNLIHVFLNSPGMKRSVEEIEREVVVGAVSPGDAADYLLQEHIDLLKHDDRKLL